MTMFRKNRSKSDIQTEYKCTIRFLDDSEPIQLDFTKETIGQTILEKVCSNLNLLERDYFGLRYVDMEKQRHWLDPLKSVYKQMKAVNPCVLCFRVKFYPADPMKLHEEITRYYLFLQLRRDLHHGRLLCAPADANLLAAYIIQSEVGDYDPQDHPPGYVAEFKMLPKQNAKMEEQIMDLHKTLTCQVPAEAEGNFLKKAATLDTYGVDPHQVKDQKGTQLYLGCTHQGIMTFHGARRTQLYSWGQIKKITYKEKMFICHANITEKLQPIGYKCMTVPACKYLWKCAIEQQFFFTLANSINTPKMKSGGTLFSRGSKFRFSGRCQNEAYSASEQINRDEPNFQRTCSLPNFARRPTDPSKSMRNSTLSAETVEEDKNKKKYRESPVDVPGQQPTAEAGPASPIIKAPIATQEIVTEEIKPQKAGAVEAGTPAIVVTTSPASDVSRLDEMPSSYEPEMTIMDDLEQDIKPAKSLEDQVRELEEEFERMQEPNHVSPISSTPLKSEKVDPVQSNKLESVANNTKNTKESSKSSSSSPSKSRCSCCKVVVYTSMFVILTLTVTVAIIMFSDIDHPVVNQLRQHLTFLEPTRDYMLDKYHSLFKK